MPRRGRTRSARYGARKRTNRRRPAGRVAGRRRTRRRSNPGPAVKAATINSVVVAGTAVGYGALERRVDLPHLDFLGQAGTYGVGAWVAGHLLNQAVLKYVGATLGAIELYKRSVVWFETDDQEKIRKELETKKAELEKAAKISAVPMTIGQVFSDDEEGTEEEIEA